MLSILEAAQGSRHAQPCRSHPTFRQVATVDLHQLMRGGLKVAIGQSSEESYRSPKQRRVRLQF